MSKVFGCDNLKPTCHYKAIIQTCWLCVWVGGGRVYCYSAMSVFIPCFLKLFEVMGAFLLEINSIMARSQRQATATAGSFSGRREKHCCRWLGNHPYLHCCCIQRASALFTAGIRVKHPLESTHTLRVNKACFLQTALALAVRSYELHDCWVFIALKQLPDY